MYLIKHEFTTSENGFILQFEQLDMFWYVG